MMRNEEVQLSRRPLFIVKTILLVLSLLFGIFGLFFFTSYLNFRAAGSCLQLALTCALYLHPTCTILKGKLHETYTFRRFRFIFILAFIIGLIMLLASILYAILGSITHQDFNFGYGFYVCIIPSSMASLWAFLLVHECRWYMREFGSEATET